MTESIPKEKLDILSKHLRQKFMFGASHSREIIAAYFGWKSHAAFLLALFTPKVIADVSNFEHVAFMEWRLNTLDLSSLAPTPVTEYLIIDIREFLKEHE